MEKSAKANVIPKRQRTQYTCMTTSVSMCLQALGHPHADEDTVNKTLGAMPMRGACWEQALACCNHYGFRSTLIVPATLPQLKQYTDQGFPIIIAYNPESKDWSHASVIFDIDDDLTVHIADPNMADPDETVRVMSKSEFYKVWSEPYNGYTIRRPAMVIQPEISSDGRQLLASYFNKNGEKPMSKNASDLGKLSEELSMLSEQMIMGKKKPKKSQPTNKKEKKKLTFTPKPPRNEAARALAENRSKGDGSGAHKNKQDYARGKRRNPKHKNRREYSLQQPLSTRPDYGVRNAELDHLAMELEARIKSKENYSDKEVQESIDQHFPNGAPDINKVRENAKNKQSETMVSEQEIDAVEKALLSMLENGEMEKMALLTSDIESTLTNLETTLKESAHKPYHMTVQSVLRTMENRQNRKSLSMGLKDDIAKWNLGRMTLEDLVANHSSELISLLPKFRFAVSTAKAEQAINELLSMGRKTASVRTRMTDRIATASGLYGFTKGVQRDCESAIRKVAKSATRIAKKLWAKDQGTCAFLNTHSKRAKSLSAKVLLTAMKEIGPKVATLSEYEPNTRLASKSGYGLYGFKSKTAQLGLSACSELKGTVGEITADLHNRRTAKREKIVGFLKEHNKVGKCVFSKFMLSAYPEGEMGKVASVNEFVPDTVQGWIEWED